MYHQYELFDLRFPLPCSEFHRRASIGHFLVAPAKTGKGYGTEALRLFVSKVFAELPVDTLELNVFNFNKAAILCYQKAGFIKTGEAIRPNGWIAVNMEIRRKGF